MNNLTRWDPFRERMSLRKAMDRFFDAPFFSELDDWSQATDGEFNMDVSEKDDEFLVKASLPGVKPEDLDITCNNNVLTIKGEVKEEQEDEQRHYHMRERRFGSFYRSIVLPSSVNADAIDASYEGGVLTLHLPKVEEEKPRRIQVQKTEAPQIIEGSAKDMPSEN